MGGKRLPTESSNGEKSLGTRGLTRTLSEMMESYTIEMQTIKYPFEINLIHFLCNTKEMQVGDTVSVYELAAKGASPYGVIGMW